MEKLISVPDNSLMREIFGVEDKNINYFEEELGITINLRPEGLMLKGPKPNIGKASYFLDKLIKLAKEGIFLDKEEISDYFMSLPSQGSQEAKPCGIKVASKKKFVFPKAQGQKKYVRAMEDYDITFAIGPAGTGKTYLAMAMAVNYLMQGKVRRIILTRPAIEAGESLGFLPGDIYAKLGPYLRPLYDALYDMMEAETIEEHLETGVIEIAPLAYMRGRTLNNAFIILDEAQNCTSEQLKMFLTRLGFSSKTVITGDITQSDLPGGKPKGITEALKILRPIKGIKFIDLSNKDVVRHPLIQKIIRAYEDFHNKE